MALVRFSKHDEIGRTIHLNTRHEKAQLELHSFRIRFEIISNKMKTIEAEDVSKGIGTGSIVLLACGVAHITEEHYNYSNIAPKIKTVNCFMCN